MTLRIVHRATVCENLLGTREKENSSLLGYYAAVSGNLLLKFRDIQSALSSGIMNLGLLTPEDGIGCPETSVQGYHHLLRNNLEKRSSLLLRGGNLNSRIVKDKLTVIMFLTIKLLLNQGQKFTRRKLQIRHSTISA
jgi:hypothetical protein